MSPGFLGVCLVAVVLKGCAAVICLYCGKGVQHLYQCSQVQQCQEGQTCYIEHVMPFQGIYTIYLAGCRDVTSCNNSACSSNSTTKSTASVSMRSDQVICSECCHHSMCNSQGCGAEFVSSTHFLRCYNCPQMYGNKICSSLINCDNRTQMCQSKLVDPSRHPADPNTVELGCGNRHICETLLKTYRTLGIPREQWPTVCCDDEHLCNWKPLDNSSLVESIANKLNCTPDLIARTTNTQGLTEVMTSPITNTPRTTTTTEKPSTTPQPPLQGKCPFDDGMCRWSNMVGDDFDWVLHSGSTPTDDTGPSVDHTMGNQTGKYVFIETSAPRSHNEKAWLRSPTFIPTVHSWLKCLHFWYSMNGDSIGTLKVYISQNNVIPGYTVWGMTGNQGRDWKQAHVTLDSHVDFYVIFEATVGDGYTGDIALDDIYVTDQPCPTVNIVG